MSEGKSSPLQQPTKETYLGEFKHLQREGQRTADLHAFMGTFPEDRSDELTGALRGVYSQGNQMFDPEKMQRLAQENPDLHKELIGRYTGFLENKLGKRK